MKNSPPLGPAPARPLTAGRRVAGPNRPDLGDARTRVLGLLAEHGAMDVAQVTRLLGGHPNTARAHLEGLVEQRLATRTPSATGRRGRPRIAYQPTTQGRLALGPSGVEELVEAVARYFAADDRASAHALAVGQIWGSLLAGGSTGPDKAQALLTLLEHAGFSPRRDDAADLSIALQTCPFLDSARAHPQVVCEMHRGLVMGALTAYGRPADHVGLHPFSEPGACRLRIAPLGERQL